MSTEHDRPLTAMLGRALTRDAAYYTIAMGSVFPLGIATALISTHYLEPAEYGRLGLLLIFSSLATIVYGLGVLQGTLMWAYGTAGDDGDGDGEDGGGEDLGPSDAPVAATRERRRRVMGSGMVLATIIAALGTALLIANAGAIGRLIGGPIPLREAVIWAAVSAGFGAVWRLGMQVYRMERRPAMFLIVSVSRHLFTLVLTFVFLSRGYGLEGAVAAVALGTALSLIVVIGGALSSYILKPRRADFLEILRRGRKYALIILSVWIVANADLWVLSRFAPGPDVGLYRLASRFGVLPSYVTSAYLMAWIPLQRSSLFRSTARARTRAGLNSTLFTYYCIGVCLLLIVLTVASELFIGLAPPAYAEAAPYVPAVAAAVTTHGLLYALFRIGRFRHRRPLYILMLLLAATVLAVLGSALAGPMGGYGVALASGLGGLMGSAGLVIAIQRGSRPIPFEWGRIAAGVGIAAVLIVLVSVSPATGVIRVIQDLAVLVVYPLLLVVTGVIPRHTVRDVLAVGRAAIPVRAGRRRLARQVHNLPADEHEAVVRWVGRESIHQLSLEVNPRDQASLAALTRAMRTLSGLGDRSDRDAQLGAYLTHRGSHVDHDLLAEALLAEGVDPLELHVLDETYQTLRQARRRLPSPTTVP